MVQKRKRSAKQLANDKRLKKLAKEGKLFKRRKASKKKIVRGKRTTARQPRKSVVRPSKTRRSRGGSASDVNKSLLLDDISRLPTSKATKMKIIRSLAKRLNI